MGRGKRNGGHLWVSAKKLCGEINENEVCLVLWSGRPTCEVGIAVLSHGAD